MSDLTSKAYIDITNINVNIYSGIIKSKSMYLEMHDNEKNNSLVAVVKDIDFEYQAETWITETVDDIRIIRWELRTEKGGEIISKWEREPESNSHPVKATN